MKTAPTQVDRVLVLAGDGPRRAVAVELWQTLPPTPLPVSAGRPGYADVNGIRLYFVEIGSGPPVVLLLKPAPASRRYRSRSEGVRIECPLSRSRVWLLAGRHRRPSSRSL